MRTRCPRMALKTPDEAEAKALLAEAGLPVPPGRRAANADEAVAAAAALGFPVALKALGIAHKSEHGAVRLNLRDAGRRARSGRMRCRGLAPASMSSAWWQAASPS